MEDDLTPLLSLHHVALARHYETNAGQPAIYCELTNGRKIGVVQSSAHDVVSMIKTWAMEAV